TVGTAGFRRRVATIDIVGGATTLTPPFNLRLILSLDMFTQAVIQGTSRTRLPSGSVTQRFSINRCSIPKEAFMSNPESNFVKPCFHSEVSRRDFFDRIMKAGITGAIAALMPGAVTRTLGAAPPPNQNEWRRCSKCRALFYNGFRSKGLCPAGRRHDAMIGANYYLTYDSPGPGQRDWRFCSKCNALFFNGFQSKGVCPGGGGHSAAGFNFTLLHDTRAAGHEKDWRFCSKCEALFYNADSDKGVCAGHGGHVAAGYNFILKFRGNMEGDTRAVPGL
ncbi:MAG: hypothetical protein QOF72_2982, partial [Blastocatellia bacterium]|nr:hypothetical protein [Blastocatellia bacterium]